MGKEFGVKPGQLEAVAKEFDEVSRTLKVCTADMRLVRNGLDSNGLGYYRGMIDSIMEASDTYAKNAKSLKDSLEDIARKYQETEQRIINRMDTWQHRTSEWLWGVAQEKGADFFWDKIGEIGTPGKITAGMADVVGIARDGLSGESEINAAWVEGFGSVINTGKDLVDDAAKNAGDLAEWASSNLDDLAARVATGHTDDIVLNSVNMYGEVLETSAKRARIFGKVGDVLGVVGDALTVATIGVDKHNKYKDEGTEGMDTGVFKDSRFWAETITESALTIGQGIATSAAAGSIGGPIGAAVGAGIGLVTGIADIGCKWFTREVFGEEYEAGLIELVAGKYIAKTAVGGIVTGKLIEFAGDALASSDNEILAGIGNVVSGAGDKMTDLSSSLLKDTTAGNEVKLTGYTMEWIGNSMASSDIGFLSEIGNAVANTGDMVAGWTVEP